MMKPISKLVFLAFLIPAIATQKSQHKDQKHLTKDNLSDDSRLQTYLDDQNTSEDLDQMDENLLRKNSKAQNSVEHPNTNIDEDETLRSQKITTNYQNHLNHDHRPSQLTEQEMRNTQDKELEVDKKLNHLEEQTTIEYQKHLNHDHRPSQFAEQEIQYRRNNELDVVTKLSHMDNNKIPKNTNLRSSRIKDQKTDHDNDLNKGRRPEVHEHTVADNNFGYMVAVLKGTTFLCAGALINESWVLTAANGIHLMREATRFLRIRIGSINFKKGGKLLFVKYLEIHPYFNTDKPNYDLALVMLSTPVRYTATLSSIRLLPKLKEFPSTHFIMTFWPIVVEPITNKSQLAGVIKHRRILSVTHLHPTDPEECYEELEEVGAGYDSVMCLETGVNDDCLRDTGSPIVINGILWGIISSWRPKDCDEQNSSIFATLVSAANTSSWINAVVHGYKWDPINK